MTHAHPGGDVGAVGRPVDVRAVDLSVVEDGADVVDHLLDGQRFGRQVRPGVVVAGHADAAVLDHDHVEALGGGPAAQAPVKRDRSYARPTGEDDHRMLGLAAGAYVEEIELLGAARRHRAAYRSNPGQGGEFLVGTAALVVERHPRAPAMA